MLSSSPASKNHHPLRCHPSNQQWYRSLAIIFRDNRPLLVRSLLNSGKIVEGHFDCEVTSESLNQPDKQEDSNVNRTEINYLDWTIFTSLDSIDSQLDRVDNESAGSKGQNAGGSGAGANKSGGGSTGGHSSTGPGSRALSSSNYIGILQPSDTHKIHGYVTASRIKFILLLDASKPMPRETDIKHFFENLHTIWMKVTANPFYKPGKIIKNMPKFVKMVDSLILKL